jgi:hypothetical protein
MNPYPDPDKISKKLNKEIRNDISVLVGSKNLTYFTAIGKIEQCAEEYTRYRKIDAFRKILIWAHYAYNMLLTQPRYVIDEQLENINMIIHELAPSEDEYEEEEETGEEETEETGEEGVELNITIPRYVQGPLSPKQFALCHLYLHIYRFIKNFPPV